jgi:hypothetical protein
VKNLVFLDFCNAYNPYLLVKLFFRVKKMSSQGGFEDCKSQEQNGDHIFFKLKIK